MQSINQKVLEIALNEYGTKGIPGSNSEAEVLKYYHGIGFGWVQNDDLAWCAAFLNWCLASAGMPYKKTLLARDMLNYGEKVEVPELGDIVIFWRISPESIYGHCGFVVKVTESVVYVLGGNQSNSVDISPYPKAHVLGYRRPLPIIA